MVEDGELHGIHRQMRVLDGSVEDGTVLQSKIYTGKVKRGGVRMWNSPGILR